MNTLNNWCRVASLVFLLLLAIEGNRFVHHVATQARAMKPQMTAVDFKARGTCALASSTRLDD